MGTYPFVTRRWDALTRDGEGYYGRATGEFSLQSLNPVDATAFVRVQAEQIQGAWAMNHPAAKIQSMGIEYTGSVP